jgi:hypothetical protein
MLTIITVLTFGIFRKLIIARWLLRAAEARHRRVIAAGDT